MGHSAGGRTPPIARQILAYPMLDDRSKEVLSPGVVTLWDGEDNRTGWTADLGTKVGGDDVPVYAAPGSLSGATGLPPLYRFVGQIDLFAKEGARYASLFVDAGIETELLVLGLPHGFNGLANGHSATNDLFNQCVKHIKKLNEA